VALALLVTAPAVQAQGSPAPGAADPVWDAFSSSNCQSRYRTSVQEINAKHVEEAMKCGGSSSCIGTANSNKAAALKKEGEKLFQCQKAEQPLDRPPTPPRASTQPVPDLKPDVPEPPPGGASPGGPTPPSRPSTPPGESPTPPSHTVRPGQPNSISKQGPDWVYTDVTGRPWIFKPSFREGNRTYVLEPNSVGLRDHITRGTVAVGLYVSKDRLIGDDKVTVTGRLAPGYR
jgi:hypothetical protein